MLNPQLRKDNKGNWWLDWSADPNAVVYDIVVSWQLAHIQAGPGKALPGPGVKLGKPVEPFTVKIASAYAQAYESVTQPPVTPPPPPTGSRPLVMPFTGGEDDYLLNATDAATQTWVQTHWQRPILYLHRSWLPLSIRYVDVAAIYNPNHPDHAGPPLSAAMDAMILRDVNGNRLFIPWGSVVNGQYPQYAANQSLPEWRQHIIDLCASYVAGGQSGVHLDDVNLPMSLNGTPAAPMNTENAQKEAVCGLLEAVRAALPSAFISHNARWFDSPLHNGADPYVERQIAACNLVTIERGINDDGLTGGTGEWSINRLFSYVDHVHGLGRNVSWMGYATTLADAESNLAAAWMTYRDGDFHMSGLRHPNNWPAVYDVDLGAAKGPRTYTGGVYRREFAKGFVTLTDARVGHVTGTG